MSGVFHPGEIRAQAMAQGTTRFKAVATGIRDYLPEQHRLFFAGLPYIMAATLDADGAPRAHLLCGAPGFVTSPDQVSLRIAPGSNMPANLRAGEPVGLLGLDFSNRRRNRANGVVRAVTADAFEVQVHESFGNCPQHITVRDAVPTPRQPGATRTFAGLSEQALIARSDTFFIASTGGPNGVDISHRGGPAGFVHIDGDTLTVPDFNGNRYFNTLGNLLLDKRAALLFIDFDSGDVLELQGEAEIVWAEDGARPGAADGRDWRFTVARGQLRQAALPLRWTRPAAPA